MIAAVILKCEAAQFEKRGNQNRLLDSVDDRTLSGDNLTRVDLKNFKDDWCRFVIHKLVYDCHGPEDLLKNNVHFITFNYDSSLEYRLFNGLAPMDLLTKEHVVEFLGRDRTVHVYGSVHLGLPLEHERIDFDTAESLGKKFGNSINYVHEFERRQRFLDLALIASKQLRTIDPHDKEEDLASLATAREWIKEAEVVYILGYGFDKNNSRRIGLQVACRGTGRKSVMFTNFQNINVVNKSAAALWHLDYTAFLHDDEGWVEGDPNGEYYLEKSVRDVYEALEKDFPPLEDQ